MTTFCPKILKKTMKMGLGGMYFGTANNKSYFGDTTFCDKKIVLKCGIRDKSDICKRHQSYAKMG